MAKLPLNGNLKWVITTVVGIIASCAVLVFVVGEMRPEVKLNTEHRLKGDAIDQQILGKLNELIERK